MLHTRIILTQQLASCGCAICGRAHQQDLTLNLLYLSEACLGPVCADCQEQSEQALTILAGRADSLMRLALMQGNGDVARAFAQVREAAQAQVAAGGAKTGLPTLQDYLADEAGAAVRNAA